MPASQCLRQLRRQRRGGMLIHSRCRPLFEGVLEGLFTAISGSG